jgi:hypothetical protein
MSGIPQRIIQAEAEIRTSGGYRPSPVWRGGQNTPSFLPIPAAHLYPCSNSQDRPMADTTAGEFPVWLTPEGEKVSCLEKIKVLNENLAELKALAQDALEDAVLMGCDERQVREVLAGIVAGLVNPYRTRDLYRADLPPWARDCCVVRLLAMTGFF